MAIGKPSACGGGGCASGARVLLDRDLCDRAFPLRTTTNPSNRSTTSSMSNRMCSGTTMNRRGSLRTDSYSVTVTSNVRLQSGSAHSHTALNEVPAVGGFVGSRTSLIALLAASFRARRSSRSVTHRL